MQFGALLEMDKKSFLQAGHTPTLLAAFLYFDLAFMVWVLLGPLGIGIAKDLGCRTPKRA
jgi:NNP family nitrate/nitrite transporter-like MFS transporter